MGSFVHGSWIWDLFEWKRPLFEDLIAKLEEERVSTCEDKWIWVHGQCGVFSLKSLYVALAKEFFRFLSCPQLPVETKSIMFEISIREWKFSSNEYSIAETTCEKI